MSFVVAVSSRYIPIKQGLRQSRSILVRQLALKAIIFSTKTRIKTNVHHSFDKIENDYYYSNKTRIKTISSTAFSSCFFTDHYYSTKTRIKTVAGSFVIQEHVTTTIPLKQGLRQRRNYLFRLLFLDHYYSTKTRIKTSACHLIVCRFISTTTIPLKQGLRLPFGSKCRFSLKVDHYYSTKTRIKTQSIISFPW